MDVSAYQTPEYLQRMQSREMLMEAVTEFNKKAKKRVLKAKLLGYVALLLWVVALFVLLVPVAPQAWYTLFPETSVQLAQRLGATVDVSPSEFGETLYEEAKPEEVWQPPFDSKLPKENMLLIDKVGVETTVEEGGDWEKALEDGVWRVPELGTPEERQLPTILAAHRFGYLWWTNEYRRENSFFNLPKVENGDRVVMIWNQRKYVFEVYEGYTDTEIREYDADLILYTCELLNSDRRIVRYARLVQDEV